MTLAMAHEMNVQDAMDRRTLVFAKLGTVDRLAVQTHPSLEVSMVVHVVLSSDLGDVEWAGERSGGRDQFERRLEVLLDIRPEV
jgi:hypothetical protein